MFEMIIEILWNVVWPLKGIIYMEEQLLQWGLAFVIAYFAEIGAILIICLGIGMLLYSAHLNRYFRGVRSGLRRFVHVICIMLRNILFAWWYLIWGAIHGNVACNEQGSRTSLHYRFGRWIYRMLYLYVFRFIHRNNVRIIVSRIVALVIILWGVWNIPYDLTH